MDEESKLTIFDILRNGGFFDNIPKKGTKLTRMKAALYNLPKAIAIS